eukprot:10095059-Ditylum_brightwellii.AAC.1
MNHKKCPMSHLKSNNVQFQDEDDYAMVAQGGEENNDQTATRELRQKDEEKKEMDYGHSLEASEGGSQEGEEKTEIEGGKPTITDGGPGSGENRRLQRTETQIHGS